MFDGEERKDIKRRNPSPYILFVSGAISHPSPLSTNSAPDGYLLTPFLYPLSPNPISLNSVERVYGI
jgi:hypothetical protein